MPPPPIGTVFLAVDARGAPRPIYNATYIFPRGSLLKTNEQLLNEITAAMADAWLAACDRRVIGSSLDGKFMVFDYREKAGLFGPASADECRKFVHRAAALDVLRMLGTERVAGAAMVAGGNIPVTLDS
jgi:hypothetical protein